MSDGYTLLWITIIHNIGESVHLFHKATQGQAPSRQMIPLKLFMTMTGFGGSLYVNNRLAQLDGTPEEDELFSVCPFCGLFDKVQQWIRWHSAPQKLVRLALRLRRHFLVLLCAE
jgi:hypothetical protein